MHVLDVYIGATWRILLNDLYTAASLLTDTAALYRCWKCRRYSDAVDVAYSLLVRAGSYLGSTIN